MTRPRCSFAEGTPYQCRKAGIGNPPLCREHVGLVDSIEDEQELSDELFVAEALRDLIDGLGGGDLLRQALGVIRTAAAQSRHRSEDPHYAECPPRPRPRQSAPPPGYGQRRAPPPPPPPPPRDIEAEDARVILGFAPSAQLTKTMVKKRQKELAAIFHPDAGGSEEAMKRVNAAVRSLLAQVR